MTNQAEDTGIIEKFTITDLDTLKVVADPLRLQILETFGSQPRTVKQVAKALGLAPNKLYYHVNMLEEHGLLRVVETRIVSGIIEKIYQVRAYSITVDKALLTVSESRQENLELMIDSMFDSTRDKLLASARAGVLNLSEEAEKPSRLHLGSWNFTMDAAQATAFVEEFEALMTKYADMISDKVADENNDKLTFSFLHAFFRTVPPHNNDVPDSEPEPGA